MNKKTRKLLTWCLVFSMIATQMLFTNVAFASNRYSGADRYQTALAIVKAGWTKADTAVIARGDGSDLADALAAAPLAYAKGKAPILLTEPNKLPDGVLDTLVALGVKNVYIVGGTGAVSDSVKAALEAKFTVKRISGADRVATSYAAAKEAFPTDPKEAVIVNAYANADALSVSSIAAAKGMPVLFVDKTMSNDVANYVSGKTVYAVGGVGVLSPAVVDAAKAKRLAGDDRYATNAAVLGNFTIDYKKVYVAKGEDANAADALAGSALAALSNSPIVLVNNTLTTTASDLLKKNMTKDSEVVALGGSAVVSDSITSAIENCKPATPATLEVESVSAINATQVQVKFNQKVDSTSATEISHYQVQGVALTGNDTATLGDDEQTVTLTLTTSGVLTNDHAYSFTIKDVKSADLSMKLAETVKSVLASDKTAPSITGVDSKANANGTTTVKLTFSEPVQTAGTFRVNGTIATYGALSTTDYSANNELTLTTQTLTAGTTYTLAYSGTTDYAGNTIVPASTSFTVVSDTTAPKLVSISQSTTAENQIVLEFDKDIKSNSFLSSDVTVEKVGAAADGGATIAFDSDRKLIVTVSSGYLGFSSTVTQKELFVSVSKPKDVSGNTITEIKKASVIMNRDITAPSFVKATVSEDNKYILVEMSKKLATGTVLSGVVTGYKTTVVNSDNINVKANMFGSGQALNNIAITDANGAVQATASKYFKLYNTANNVIADGTYTVKIAAGAFTDLALTPNDSQAIQFTIDVATAANSTRVQSTGTSITSAPAVNGDFTETLTVTFNTKVNTSALDPVHYAIDGVTLDSNTNVYFADDTKTKVQIVLPVGTVDTDATSPLTITGVQNSAGLAQSNVITLSGSFKDNTRPTLVSSKNNSSSQMTFTFSEPITSANAARFHVVKADGTVINGTSVVSTTVKQVIIAINTAGVDLTTAKLELDAAAVTDQSASNVPNAKVTNVSITDDSVSVPTFTATQINNNPSTTGWQISFTSKANDASESVKQYDIYLFNTDPTLTTAAAAEAYSPVKTYAMTDIPANGIVTLPSITKDSAGNNLAAYADGRSYYVYIVAVDQAGNKAISASATATVDLTAPVLSVSSSSGLTNLVLGVNEDLNYADGADLAAYFTISTTGASITSAIYDKTADTITFTIADASTPAIANGDTIAVKATLADTFGNTTTAATVATYASGTTDWR